MVVVNGSVSSLLTSRVKVPSSCGWAALQAVSAAQARNRLSKPVRVIRQFSVEDDSADALGVVADQRLRQVGAI